MTAAARKAGFLEELLRARLRAVVDPRTTPCQIAIRQSADAVEFEGWVLNGKILAALVNLACEVFGGRSILTCRLQVLSKRSPTFVRIGWEPAPFYRSTAVDVPDTLTTALPGCVLRVFLKLPGFYLVQHTDGYVGHIEAHLATPVPRHVYTAWRNGPTATIIDETDLNGRRLPLGSRLTLRPDGRVILPDGHPGAINPAHYERREPATALRPILDALGRVLPQYHGTPYHWGGKTQAGTDCSGFVQTVAGIAGISLPRDASMQCHVGEVVGVLPGFSDLLPGDIIFFMNDRGFVYHVGIWLGDKRFAHSSRQFGGVVISSMAPGGEKHSPQYLADYCYARRVGRL